MRAAARFPGKPGGLETGWNANETNETNELVRREESVTVSLPLFSIRMLMRPCLRHRVFRWHKIMVR